MKRLGLSGQFIGASVGGNVTPSPSPSAAGAECECGELDAVPCSEFGEDRVDVCFDGGNREKQGFGYFGVRVAGGNELDHFFFALRQSVNRLRNQAGL